MKTNITRRKFLKTSSLVTFGISIVPRHVLGGNGYIAPSDKLNIASIGAGGKGFSDIKNTFNKGRENIVALCDIDAFRCKKALESWPKAAFYNDFRKMLENSKDIDAVIISSPDHTHAVAVMAAMQLGKHVYVQKPLTHNIKEARLLTESAEKYKIVSQMGNQGASNPNQLQMQEWFQNGLIGKVSEVYVWTDRPVWPQGIPVPTEKIALPKQISKKNWDLFIGPASYVKYHPLYHPFKWRGWWNFGTGALGDMGCHLIDPAFKTLGLGYPTKVECSVGQVFTKDWIPEYIPEGCPPSSKIKFTFPPTKNNPTEVNLYWNDGGIRPFIPDTIPDNHGLFGDGRNGVMMVGEKGIITCDTYGRNPKAFLKNGDIRTVANKYGKNSPLKNIPEWGHQTSWVKAVKSGYNSKEHKALTSSFDYAGPLTETVLMGNLAIRSYQYGVLGINNRRNYSGRKKLYWDGKNMQITNYDVANQFVGRQYREGWSL